MYLLDANIFIQSNRAHYGLDFVPAFLDWLDQAFAAGLIRSIDPIGAELAAGGDDLSIWAAARKPMFRPMDARCAQSLIDISAWANAGSFTPQAVSKFFGGADYELVAYARAHGFTVVTMEKSEPGSKKSIKIPDVCIQHSVAFKTPFEMLRDEGVQFVLP